MSAPIPLVLLAPTDDSAIYRQRLRAWHDILRAGATQLSGKQEQEGGPPARIQNWNVPKLDACLRLGRRDHSMLPADEFDVATFRLGPKPGEPWLVQINLPNLTTEQGNTRLARESNGSDRIWLMRRGELQKNGAGPAISEEEFMSKMPPDGMLGENGSSPYPGAWYKVAMLDGTPDEILGQPRRFLEACDLLRKVHDVLPNRDGEPNEHDPIEPEASYKVPAQAEKLVDQRIHPVKAAD